MQLDSNVPYSSEGMAYDNMHFSPAGLHLFAIVLSDWMNVIR
jgi:hypothetical protein